MKNSDANPLYAKHNQKIGKGDPFKTSLIENRRDIAKSLDLIVQNFESPFVVAIDAPWGVGKTDFINRWKSANSFEDTILINAWETDFSSQPLHTMLARINEYAEERGTARGIIESSKKILRWSVVKGASLAGLGEAIGIAFGAGEETELDVAKAVVNKAVDLVFNAERSIDDVIDEFKEELKKLADKSKPRLVILIDELDRCRPTYAIELLETVKHLFSVTGVIFVISIDKLQLANSIQAVYGANFDANKYLERFIDITLTLPLAISETMLYEFAGRLNLHTVLEQSTLDAVVKICFGSFEEAKLNYRRQFQLFAKLAITVHGNPAGSKLKVACICTLLSIIQENHPNFVFRLQLLTNPISALAEICHDLKAAERMFAGALHIQFKTPGYTSNDVTNAAFEAGKKMWTVIGLPDFSITDDDIKKTIKLMNATNVEF